MGLRGSLSSLVVLACLALFAAGAAGGSSPPHRIGGIVPPFGKAPHAVSSDAARGGCHGPNKLADCGLLRYGGGPVMHNTTVYTIFWQPTGYTSWDGGDPYSPGYQGLIAQYFQDLQADSGLLTNVYGADTQYCSGAPIGLASCTGVPADDFISTDVTYGGTWTDTQNFPASDCDDPLGNTTVCLTDQQLTDEIDHAIATNGLGWTKSATHMFFIYTPRGVTSCVDSFCAYDFYCAYHSNVGTGSNALIYANMPYPVFEGFDFCEDSDHPQHPNGDGPADIVLSATSHEHAEAITDPEPVGGWWDAEDFVTGGENGDKCAYYYGKTTGQNGAKHNQVINGHQYYLQLEWSNSDHDCVASYSPGMVKKLKPTDGVVGQPITLTGRKLNDVTTVEIGGTAASSFVERGNKVTVVPAPGTATGSVTLTTGHGVITGPVFTVDPSPVPAIKSFSPKSTVAGKTVTVTGSGFWGASAVQVDGADVQAFTVKSSTKLSFVVAAGNTSGQVTVTTPGGTAVSAGTLTIP